MARHWKIAVVVLAVLALVGAFSFPALLHSVLGLKRANATEEQARRTITQPALATPSDARVQAQLFFASVSAPGTLELVMLNLPLSADPVQRGKQLIAAMIEQAPSVEQRTLPADAELLQFYLLPDGTAVADFSDTLVSKTPSGILSEGMVVDSITRTLGANLTGVNRLKILIRGEETDTLAGHFDLTGFIPVVAPAAPDAASLTAPGANVAAGTGTNSTQATAAAPAAAPSVVPNAAPNARPNAAPAAASLPQGATPSK